MILFKQRLTQANLCASLPSSRTPMCPLASSCPCPPVRSTMDCLKLQCQPNTKSMPICYTSDTNTLKVWEGGKGRGGGAANHRTGCGMGMG